MPKAPSLSIQKIPAFHSHALVHGIFRRYGGESDPPFDSLNVSFGVGDEAARVKANRQRIKMALGLSGLVSSRQIHGDRVLLLDRMPAGDFEADGFDALITNQRGIGLMVQQADCQAVLLADTSGRAVGVCHVGWRGSVANLIGTTVACLERQLGIDPADLLAAVSPSLGPCCAEFINYRQELPESFWTYQSKAAYFDFWAISRMQLQDAGVQPANISIAGICTVCDPGFFSYRREKKTGRFASVLGMRNVGAE
jgi:YfiH family protein